MAALITVFYIAEKPINAHQSRVAAQSVYKQEQAKTLLSLHERTNRLLISAAGLSIKMEGFRELRRNSDLSGADVLSILSKIFESEHNNYFFQRDELYYELMKAYIILPKELVDSVVELVMPIADKHEKIPVIWERIKTLGAKALASNGLSPKDSLAMKNTLVALENMYILGDNSLESMDALIDKNIELSSKLKTVYPNYFIVD